MYNTLTISELLGMAMEGERERERDRLIAVAPVAKVQLKSGDLLPDLTYMPPHALVYHDSACMALSSVAR